MTFPNVVLELSVSLFLFENKTLKIIIVIRLRSQIRIILDKILSHNCAVIS